MRKYVPILLALVSWILLAFVPPSAPRPAIPSAYDVIEAVNDLRADYNLAPLTTNTSLMVSAQNHTDYLASIGYANITNGHVGADGTDALDRAIAAGYPVAQGIDVQDCWAYMGNTAPTSRLFSDANIWNDSIHMAYILHENGKDVGVGVSEKDGYIYYDLVISFIYGSGSTTSTTSLVITPKVSTTPQVVPVAISTPDADGSIKHIVQPGQALWSIAITYGTTVEHLQALNNLSAKAVIYEGETLLIRLANTPTPSPTITPTPRPPTRTPVPPQLAETVEPNAAADNQSLLGGLDRTTIGLILVLVCGIGLVLISMSALRRGK